MQLTHDLIIPFLVIYPKELEQCLQRFAHLFTAVLFTIAKGGCNQISLRKDELDEHRCYAYDGMYSAFCEGNPVTGYNRDGT